MATITKSAMAHALKTTLGAKYRDTDASYLLFVSEIIEWITKKSLEPNASVMIPRFGKFKNKLKTERIGRNPKTGKKIKICERRIVNFLPGPVLSLLSKNNPGAGDV